MLVSNDRATNVPGISSFEDNNFVSLVKMHRPANPIAKRATALMLNQKCHCIIVRLNGMYPMEYRKANKANRAAMP
jgi:hypothetical protein